MLASNRMAKSVDPEYGAAVAELLQSTSRLLIMASAAIYFGFLVATVVWPVQLAVNTWSVAPGSIVLLLIALWLLPRSYLAANLLWQATMAASITLAAYLFQQPELAVFYILLPMTASVCMGGRAGLAAQALISLLLIWLSRGLMLTAPSMALLVGVWVAGAIAGVLGWASTRAVLTTTSWSLGSYRVALRNLEDARDHRGQLVQAVKELDAAYIRLERVNQMLNQARAEAEETKSARNRFSLAISHELRTPLNFIIGFSEIMMKTPATYAPLQRWPPGLYDDVQEIYKSCKHLMLLVNDVLDLGQIDNLHMNLIKEWIDMAQIVAEVQGMMQRAFDLKGIALQTEIEPELPRVYVDRTRIRQVLLNLVNNSLRYTDYGATTIRLKAQESELLVCVADTGVGIAKEDIPRVFEEFQQVNKDSWRRHEGAGLGIPISKRFVDLHGGNMWVESELRKGTNFYFTLPLSTGTLRTVMHSGGDAVYWQALLGQPEAPRNVLVVSADSAAGVILAPYVEGCTLTTVTTEHEIVAQVRERLPQALLLDNASAHLYNLEAIMVDLPYDLPIISFHLPGSTAGSNDLPSGVQQRLVKPFSNQALLDAIRALGTGVRTLLVVGEDPAMLRLISRILDSQQPEQDDHGYVLTAASGSVEALVLVADQAPDAMLLDVALPDQTTLAILQKAQTLGMPVILITAIDWGQAGAGSKHQGIRLQMRRPLTQRELASVLKSLLDAIQPKFPAKSPGEIPGLHAQVRQAAANGPGIPADPHG